MEKIVYKQRHKIVPASYLYLVKDGKMLLMRRFNTDHKDGMYSMVAGHVDSGESFTQCIVREAKEEAGIILKTEDLRVVHISQRITNEEQNNERIDVFLTTERWGGEIENKELHKCDDLSWFDLNNLPENTIPYIKSAIENINNEIFYSELGWQ